MSIQQSEHFTENTLFKVYDVLRAVGLTEDKAREAINEMQNQGILFRERVQRAASQPVLRQRRARERYLDDEDD